MNELTKQVLRILFFVLLIGWLGYTLWIVRSTLIYILISALVSLIGKPLVDLLTGERWPWLKINRSLAAALTLLFFGGLIAALVSFFVPALLRELQVLAQIDYESLFRELKGSFYDFQTRYGVINESPPADQVSGLAQQIEEWISFDGVTDTLTGVLGGVGSTAFAIFSIIFISFFFMRERYLFRNIVLALVPDAVEEKVLHVSPRMRNTLTRYFIGILVQITIITIMVSVGLRLVGFQNTIAIGLFSGFINVIPYVGPIIGATFGLVLGLAQTLGPGVDMSLASAAILLALVYGIMQLTDNFVLQPVIFSTSIRAHPLEIFIVISFAASLAGIVGMIVAIPVYSILRLLAAEFLPNQKFVRWLIHGERSKLPPST